jgi:small GTP-binding protein
VFLLDESGALIGLNLSSSSVVDLTDIVSLRHLRFLDLSNNNIIDASALRHLPAIEKIDLAFNQIDNLSFVHHLPKLTYLDVRSNQICRLPSSFSSLTIPIKWHYVFQHRGIFLEGNPLTSPPPEIIMRGEADLRAYLEVMEGGTVPLGEVKAIILGGGRAGKTSLVRRLAGEPFRPDEEVTRGVNLRTVQGGSTLKAHLWDFGGQEFMFAVHSCFFTKRAVYLVVIDGRHEEKADYWLKLIQIMGGDSPIFVLINKMDENPRYDLNRGELRRKWPTIEGFYPISCSTGQGIEDFICAFWRRVPEFDLSRMEFAPSWIKAKDSLLASGESLATYDYCKRACAEHGLVDLEQQTALLNCLHDLGLILHFTGRGLGGFAVLHPLWLTTAMYALLDDSAAKDQNGLVSWDDIDRILSQFDRPLNYSAEARRFVIEVMTTFEVCFEVDDEQLLIPDLLQRREPSTLPKFEGSTSEMALRFDLLPISVFHRCIIRLREDIELDLLWLTGSVLQHSAMNTRALLRLDQVTSSVHIIVEGGRRRDYLTIIRHAIGNAVRASGTLSYVEYVRLPTSGDDYISYPELCGLKRMDVEKYYHGVSGKVFQVRALLSQVEASDTDSAPLEDTGAKTIGPDVPKRYVFVAYARIDRPYVDQLAERLRLVGINLWYDVSINPGSIFSRELENKILNCSAMVIIVSPESHQSTFIRDEIALATQHNKPLIPIQLRVVDKWLDIASKQWLFASDEGVFAQLFKSLLPHL